MAKSSKKLTPNSMILVCIMVALLVYSLLPSLRDFRNSIYGNIVVVIILGAYAAYLTFSKNNKKSVLGIITIWTYICIRILFVILGVALTGFTHLRKVNLIVSLVYTIFNVVVSIFLYIKHKKSEEYKFIWGFGFLAYLPNMIIVIQTNHINGDFNWTFVIPAIVVAVVAFIPALIYGIKKYKSTHSLDKLIAVPLAALLIGFVATWMTVSSMNVTMDFSTPSYENFVLVDKDVRTGARRMTTYIFTVQSGDTTFDIDVDDYDYHNHEINETIMLSKYKGAFNEPYYIYEANANKDEE